MPPASDVVICTGRMLQSAQRVVARLGLSEGPVICYQGALVADLASGKWLRHVPMDGAAAAEVVRHVRAMGRQLNAYIDDRLYVEQVTRWARLYAEHVEVGIDTVDDMAGGGRAAAADEAGAGHVGGRRRRDPAGAAGALAGTPLRGPLAARLHRVRRRLGQQERHARLALRAARGRSAEAVVTLGDGMNDVDMLEWAGLGVAVAEAAEPVRAAADLVVPRAGIPGLLADLAEAPPQK